MPGRPDVVRGGQAYQFRAERACRDVVGRWATGLWCEMVEDANPVYHDGDFCRSRGFTDVVAPPTMFLALTAEPTWTPAGGAQRPHSDALSDLPELPHGAIIQITLSVRRLIVIGERLRVDSYLNGPSAATVTRRGRGRLMRTLVVLRDGQDDEVASLESTVLRFATIADAESPPAASAVSTGDVPALHFPLPLTRFMIAVAATRDFYEVHHDGEFARAIGAPDMFIGTHFMQGLIGRYANDWAGPEWRLARLDLVPYGRCHPGDTMTITGRVAGFEDPDVVPTRRLDVTCSTESGITHEATVELVPLRASVP